MTIRHRTKIIATLGPSTDNHDHLKKMIDTGLDLARLNFSHGDVDDHINRIKQLREVASAFGREIGVIADLQGPKIRICRFKDQKITLKKGQTFILDINCAKDAGTEERVGIAYKELINDVKAGDALLLDDGRLELTIKECTSSELICEVKQGGTLSNNKGINKRGGGLSASALTEKDKEDLKAAVAMGADYIAISFVRNADDIREARALIKAAGGDCGVIAKIERREAMDAIDDIIRASDAIMVARGDLGVELGDAAIPRIQKRLIQRARELDKAVITATQMMESMIHSPIPTRAEVSDVANAIYDGTDAVMLSAETATGDFPVETITSMARVCQAAEEAPLTTTSKHRLECTFKRVDEAIAMAAMYTANHMNIRAIIALTESGSTTLWMSRIRSGIPIYGLSRSIATQRRMTLYRGVYPIHFDPTHIDRREVNTKAIEKVQSSGLVHKGDNVIITKGNSMGELGGTNAMKIIRVGDEA